MIAAAQIPIDADQLQAAVDDVNRLMRFHGGAIDVVDVNSSGAVEVRFGGMCQGCQIRPVTFYATIVPRLERVDGVTEVRARGFRIAEENREWFASINHLS